MTSTRLLLILPLSAAALLSACVIAPYPARRVVYAEPAGAQPYYDDEAVTDFAPPAPYAEVVPVIPFAGAVWLGGYWGWNGGRHAWVPGRWDRARPGYAYRPHAWAQQGGRWHLRGGGWYRR